MNHDQFTYWLQGFVEMNGGKEPTKAQWQMIKDHLQLCFIKMTPPLQPYAKGVGTGGVGTGVIYSSGKDQSAFGHLKSDATNFYALMQGNGGGGIKRNGGGGGC